LSTLLNPAHRQTPPASQKPFRHPPLFRAIKNHQQTLVIFVIPKVGLELNKIFQFEKPGLVQTPVLR